MSIVFNMPLAEYRAIDALSISRLKEIKRSPQHYLHLLHHPRETTALKLGTAAHMAVLEPVRFMSSYAVWSNRTESGAMSPRRGKVWDEFAAGCGERTIITGDENELAEAIQRAVRMNETAMKYLEHGDAEATMLCEKYSRQCKGRMDWFTEVADVPTIIGLKTARDCRPFVFGKQSAVLGYHMQWAWYYDLFWNISGQEPQMKEIVVESAPPHAVAVYHITEDIISQGREDYQALLKALDECETTGLYPGPVVGEEDLTLPTWCYTQGTDDLSELGLEQAG